MYKHIRLEKSPEAARLILARPKHNVLNIEMMGEITAVLSSWATDAELKGVVIAGEGASFCAGVDVGEHSPELVDQMIAAFNGIFAVMEKIEVPLIAEVQGACLGGGLELAIACDIIVAAREATFGQPEIRLGFFPPYAAVRLPKLIGPAKAIEICTTGRTYSAAEAMSLGLLSRVTAKENLAQEVEEIVANLKAMSPLIVRLNKRAVTSNLDKASPKALAAATDLFLKVLMKTEDTREGIKSFYERRKPIWKNR